MFTDSFIKKNIVCIGGGNAMPKVVLSGLKNKNINLTVVSAVLDSGGSSGRLRKDYDVISPPLKLCTDNGIMIAPAG
jgi:2-phospho-L-lactate transferase/gluconeogenesis factor (CofD/UPF0052 family)